MQTPNYCFIFLNQNKYFLHSDPPCDTIVYVLSVAMLTFRNIICVQLADALVGQMLEE